MDAYTATVDGSAAARLLRQPISESVGVACGLTQSLSALQCLTVPTPVLPPPAGLPDSSLIS